MSMRPADYIFTDRLPALEQGRCVNPPIGCGQSVGDPFHFRTEGHRREYNISALCQQCQDDLFGPGEE